MVNTVWGDGPYHYFEHPECASGATPHVGSLDTRDADFYYLLSRISEYFTNLMIILFNSTDSGIKSILEYTSSTTV